MTLPRRAEAPPSGVPSWARVGQKVICIYECEHGPKLRETCEICEVAVDNHGCWLFIAGYDGWTQRNDTERVRQSYSTDNFRPLITKSQDEDIAEFRKLLTGQPVRENERA